MIMDRGRVTVRGPVCWAEGGGGLRLVHRRGMRLVLRGGLRLVDGRGLRLVDGRGIRLVGGRGIRLVHRGVCGHLGVV